MVDAHLRHGIWDVHTHLAGLPGRDPGEKAEHLLRYAARLGIHRVCVFMGLTWQYDPTPEELAQANREVLEVVKRFPDQVFGFVYLNPNHRDASLDEFRRHVVDGPMVGIKLWVARRCADPVLDPIIEAAIKYQVPILQHTYLKTTGNLPGESTPEDLATLARRHPEATFIAAHCGGNWELGFRIFRNCPNILVDLSGFDPTAGATEAAVHYLGAQRVVFGSDAPGRSFATQLGKVLGAAISDQDRELILRENLRRLLAPVAASKGYRL